MTILELATMAQSNAQIGFDNRRLELLDILQMYHDRLDDSDASPEELVEEVRLLTRTVEYKHEQLLKLATEINANWRIVAQLDRQTAKKEAGG